MVPMDDAMKEAILDKHNQLRNQIATKKIANYDSAANMATMVWDDALASNAALNVHQCEMEHDDCRNTGKFIAISIPSFFKMLFPSVYLNPYQVTDDFVIFHFLLSIRCI